MWSEPITPEPRNEGSVLEIVSSSALPSLERHAVPVEMAITLLAVLVKPAHGAHTPAAGRAKFLPMKLEPPLPKPPFVAMQRSAALLQSGAINPSANITWDALKRIMKCLRVRLRGQDPGAWVLFARSWTQRCHGGSVIPIVLKVRHGSVCRS